jgi:hypothetical protein
VVVFAKPTIMNDDFSNVRKNTRFWNDQILTLRGVGRMTEAVPLSPLICPVCGNCVDLENSKADGDGNAVHPRCYVDKIVRIFKQQNSKRAS